MIWVTWRQFRGQALTALVLLAGAAIALLVTGRGMHHSYSIDLAACTPLGNCDSTMNDFQDSWAPVFNLTQLLVVITPALIGTFWGAPLIGRELETGTHQLAWNQTVTPTRWLAVKVTGIGVAAIATAGLLSWLLTWWAGPLDHLNGDRWAAMTFASRDIVPLGYAAFAFALGTALGLLIRRTLPAMAITLALFIAIQIVIPTLIRPHVLSSTTTTFAINQSSMSQAHGISGGPAGFHIYGLPTPQGAWVISDLPVENASGQAAHIPDYANCFSGPGAGGKFDFSSRGACLASYNLHETVTYQPASRYWPLQWIETGIFFVLAGALAGTCFWWIRRRQD
jgi:hypothetical protein